MIAHTTLPVSDYPRAKRFYAAALKPLGYANNMEFGESAGFNDGKNTDFWIGHEQTFAPLHLAFEARSREQVQAFHEAALAAGGRDNGEPGYRDYWPGILRGIRARPGRAQHRGSLVRLQQGEAGVTDRLQRVRLLIP